MKKAQFDEFAHNYTKILEDQHKIFGSVDYYSECKIKIAKSLCTELKIVNILEYGCGVGKNFPYIQSFFKDSNIYGYDISEESILIAKNLYPNIKFISTDKLKEYEDFFDLILIAGVYHHIHPGDRDQVTKTIYKLIKANGMVIVFEHNPYNPITRYLVKTCVFDKDAVLLTKNDLLNIFRRNGFYEINQGYYLFLPPRLKKFSFIERYLKNVPLGGQYYVAFKKISIFE